MVRKQETSEEQAAVSEQTCAVARICVEMISWEGEGEGKEAEFRRVLHEHLRFRRANGVVDDLKSFVSKLGSGAKQGRTLCGEVDVSHYETMAVAVLIVRSGDGRQFRNARIFLRGGARGWQLVSWCNEEVKGPG
jgi:hypothetical protein